MLCEEKEKFFRGPGTDNVWIFLYLENVLTAGKGGSFYMVWNTTCKHREIVVTTPSLQRKIYFAQKILIELNVSKTKTVCGYFFTVETKRWIVL